ncbi:MAG: STAS domain-containing protein [Oscillochloridaceae bacterium umkhey_bin13]
MIEQWLSVPGDLDTQRRGRMVFIVVIILFVANLSRVPLGFLLGAAVGEILPATVFGILVTGLTYWLTRRGQVDLAAWLLTLAAIAVVAITPLLRNELIAPVMFLSLPVFLAGLMLRPWHVPFVLGLALAVLAAIALLTTQVQWRGGELPFVATLVALMIMVGLISLIEARLTASLFADANQAREAAEQAAAQLQAMNVGLESTIAVRTEELRRALAEVEARAATQANLLAEIETQDEVIHELSVPVLPVRDDTLVMPLVGALDSARLHQLQSRALTAVKQSRARRLLLDITGVPVVDTQVAQGLIQVIHATRLLGAEPVLVGVRPEVAQTLVTLGIDLAQVRTAASLQSALG